MIGSYRVAETDYKAESEDVLYALSDVFGEDLPMLSSDEMRKLAEAYSMEQTEDIIKAFGQEITTAGHKLFEIEEDSDSYVLTIIPAEQEEVFLQEMKSLKRKTICMTQPRKRFGSPANRIDFGKRLTGTPVDLDSSHLIFGMIGNNDIYYNSPFPDNEAYGKTSIFCFDPQPAVIATVPKLIKSITYKDGKYAAIMFNPERRSFSSGITDRNSYIAVGEKLEDICDWKQIGVIEYDRGFVDSCSWFGDNLFLAGAFKAYVIRNAMGPSPNTEILYEEKGHKSGPNLFVMKDSLYLVKNGQILRWKEGGFLRKAGFKECIFKNDPSNNGISSVLVLNDTEVAFVEPSVVDKKDEVPMMDITVLNVETEKIRKLHTYRGWIYSVRQDEIIVLCNHRFKAKDNKKFPLMAILDAVSGQQKILPFGCLGPAEISGVYKTKDGRLLLHTEKKIILPDDLDAFLTGGPL